MSFWKFEMNKARPFLFERLIFERAARAASEFIL
jgi:hypothetical protein